MRCRDFAEGQISHATLARRAHRLVTSGDICVQVARWAAKFCIGGRRWRRHERARRERPPDSARRSLIPRAAAAQGRGASAPHTPAGRDHRAAAACNSSSRTAARERASERLSDLTGVRSAATVATAREIPLRRRRERAPRAVSQNQVDQRVTTAGLHDERADQTAAAFINDPIVHRIQLRERWRRGCYARRRERVADLPGLEQRDALPQPSRVVGDGRITRSDAQCASSCVRPVAPSPYGQADARFGERMWIASAPVTKPLTPAGAAPKPTGNAARSESRSGWSVTRTGGICVRPRSLMMRTRSRSSVSAVCWIDAASSVV